MHAYLLIGTDKVELKLKIENLAKKLNAKILDFPIVKVEDTRNLNNLIRLSFDIPTLIVCENIQNAGEEALNAFLKNLEEPQENIYFALTAPSVRKVLPTIVSRCEIVKVKSSKKSELNDDSKTFSKLPIGKKFNVIDKIKDRNNAIEFAENLVNFLHSQLHLDDVKYSVLLNNIKVAEKTLSGLKANGNVNLHLTYLVTHIINGK